LTQACALACRHCRAEAMPVPHPLELTYEEGVQFLRQIPDFGNPLPQLILTGGVLLNRESCNRYNHYPFIDTNLECLIVEVICIGWPR
jgi:MoaA/NifB/PqqE/SkfB family radical SAM enzyme